MGQFIEDNSVNESEMVSSNDNTSYGNYYRPVERKPPIGRLIFVLLILVGVILFLWLGGYLTPVNKQASYETLEDKICNASKSYLGNSKYNKNIEGLNVPGKIIYLKVRDLVNADLIEVTLNNPLTGEQISLKTDIKLKVVSKGNIQCDGFAWAEDDKVVPNITLNGDQTIKVSAGDTTFKDPGVTVIDNRDGDISNKVVRSGNVNINQAGTYYITYSVIDRAGNLSEKVRTIIVQ